MRGRDSIPCSLLTIGHRSSSFDESSRVVLRSSVTAESLEQNGESDFSLETSTTTTTNKSACGEMQLKHGRPNPMLVGMLLDDIDSDKTSQFNLSCFFIDDVSLSKVSGRKRTFFALAARKISAIRFLFSVALSPRSLVESREISGRQKRRRRRARRNARTQISKISNVKTIKKQSVQMTSTSAKSTYRSGEMLVVHVYDMFLRVLIIVLFLSIAVAMRRR